MRTSDINAFKGKAKDAILAWAGEQIDQLLPNKVAARAMLKNAAANLVERYDHKINQGIDAAFLMLGDAQGNIDSDSLVDLICDMLKEMPPTDYALGPIGAVVGKGEISLQFPGGLISDLIVGGLGGARITTADIQKIKTLIS